MPPPVGESDPTQLVRAILDPTGSVVLLDFDARPTNRAGMGDGIGSCTAVFDDATVALMQGMGESEPQCVWVNSTRMRAQLGRSTQLLPLDVLTVRSAAIHPPGIRIPHQTTRVGAH